MNDLRDLKKSVLSVRFDDSDDDDGSKLINF